MSTSIESLPDQVLLYIFTHVNHYHDFDSIRSVCKRWYFLAIKAAAIMQRAFKRCDQFKWFIFFFFCILKFYRLYDHLYSFKQRCTINESLM